jgi:uncharacterized membrane protein
MARLVQSSELSIIFLFDLLLTMINLKKQKKKRILMIAMAIIHLLSILLQKKESERLLQFSRKPIIGRKRAKIVNIHQYLGKKFFRRAY